MKAWVSHRLGSPRTSLTLKPNHPLPSPLPPTSTNLLIHVSHAALNPADLVFLSLLPPSLLPFRRTPIPGLDFSGTVVSAGPDATLSPGTRVCGTLSVRLVATGHGSLAKYVLVPEGLVAKVPEGLGMGEAAGLGVVGQTATLAMRATEGALVDGKEGRRRKVLVNGASGGLGSMIVQLAKAEGARVVGVCSAGNGEFVRGMGADEVRVDCSPRDARG
jgi:NADPH:quinone reductase-like Zn-dependent oxidoreductase